MPLFLTRRRRKGGDRGHLEGLDKDLPELGVALQSTGDMQDDSALSLQQFFLAALQTHHTAREGAINAYTGTTDKGKPYFPIVPKILFTLQKNISNASIYGREEGLGSWLYYSETSE